MRPSAPTWCGIIDYCPNEIHRHVPCKTYCHARHASSCVFFSISQCTCFATLRVETLNSIINDSSSYGSNNLFTKTITFLLKLFVVREQPERSRQVSFRRFVSNTSDGISPVISGPPMRSSRSELGSPLSWRT